AAARGSFRVRTEHGGIRHGHDRGRGRRGTRPRVDKAHEHHRRIVRRRRRQSAAFLMTRFLNGGRGARWCARPGPGSSACGGHGQATVEFALVLPLVLAMLLLLVQIALVGRDELLVVHAARDAVREATLTATANDVGRAAQRTLPGSVARIVRRGAVGEQVEVEVSYVSHTSLPLIGILLPDVTVRGASVMRVERT